MSTLGIDFGTSNSSASYIDHNNQPQAVRFVGQNEKMPSLVSFYGDQTSIGYKALFLYEGALPPDQKRLLFAQTAKSIKKELLPNGRFYNHSHRDIVSMILKHIKEESEKSCQPQVFDKLVLTHPVQFEEWKKELYREASLDAGFNEVELLQEPVSAALGYIGKKALNNIRGILVYDFGAGTFDVAYVTKHDNRFIVPIPAKGDSNCGGDDIDECLYNFLIETARPIIGKEYDDQRDIGLLRQCTKWKEMLSTMDSLPVTIRSKTNPSVFQYTLTRDKLNELSSPFVDKTISLTRSVYDEVKGNRLPLDFILLIGGSSNLPIIQKKLEAAFPDVAIRHTGDADLAVALGASYYSLKPVDIKPEEEWCYCMYCGKKILKSYNFCIYCGKENYLKTQNI